MISCTVTWPSPAKLNLFLYITGRRADGYHTLQTLFQFLDYADQLTITPRLDGQLNLLKPLPGIPNEQNLILRAAIKLRQALPPTFAPCGADISLQKVIPLGGGLGGGSSNAATVLIALNTLWEAGLSDEQLMKIGLSLGADIPVFIKGHASLAEGIGEILQPAYPKETWYLVIHPGIHISTAAIFADPKLRRNSPVRSLKDLLDTPYANDCETLVRKRFHEVEQVVLWLLEYAPLRLTGTGACMFAEFNTELAAHQVLNQVSNKVQGFVARGINQSPLHLVRDQLLMAPYSDD